MKVFRSLFSCFLLARLVVVPVAIAALETGQKYDFLCKDGQNIRNAEVISEDVNGCSVKIRFMDELIFIAKDNLMDEPRKTDLMALKRKKREKTIAPDQKESTPIKNPSFISKIGIGAGGGYVFNDLSKFETIFPYNHVLSGELTFFFRKRYFRYLDGISLLGDFLEFRNDGRHLLIYSAQIGASFVMMETAKKMLQWRADISIGASQRDMLGYEFQEKNQSFIGQFSSGVRLQFSFFYISVSGLISYMHDQEIFFAPYGGVVRIGMHF